MPLAVDAFLSVKYTSYEGLVLGINTFLSVNYALHEELIGIVEIVVREMGVGI